MKEYKLYQEGEQNVREKLRSIIETNLNYKGDMAFISKLLLKDFSFNYNNEFINLLDDSEIHEEIKFYITSTLPDKTIKNIDETLKRILLDNDLSFEIKLEILKKVRLEEKDLNKLNFLPMYLINGIKKHFSTLNIKNTILPKNQKKIPDIKILKSTNLWNIERDGYKKSLVFYLRYGDTNESFDDILLEIVEKVRLKIKSGDSNFENIIIVFRRSDVFDERLLNLVKKGDDTIKFAFVEGNDFKAIINSPIRNVIYFSNGTPEGLLNEKNGKTIICEAIRKRFKLDWIGDYDYIPLPWSACDDEVKEEYPYVEVFMKCVDKLEPSLKEKTIKKVFNILKITVNY